MSSYNWKMGASDELTSLSDYALKLEGICNGAVENKNVLFEEFDSAQLMVLIFDKIMLTLRVFVCGKSLASAHNIGIDIFPRF